MERLISTSHSPMPTSLKTRALPIQNLLSFTTTSRHIGSFPSLSTINSFSLTSFSLSPSNVQNREQPPFSPLGLRLQSSHHRCCASHSQSSASPVGFKLQEEAASTTQSRKDAGGGGVALFLKKAVPAGAVILLSALIMILTQPAVAPPAFASVQTAAAKAGGFAAVRTELLSSAWTGFFAGCLHTLSGPDHLAALAPLSIGRTRMESAAVGALWGCGHDAGQVIFGLLFLLLKDRLHIEVIRTWGTRVVGLTLLVIGLMGIREASEVPAPCVALENGECDVSLIESMETTAPAPVGGKKKIGLATFATGIVHGLQPDALMMVLPALALPSRVAGAAFLGMFLLGTVVAMGSYTVFIGSCSQALKERVPRITEKLTWAASFVAMALGVAILISQFFGFSLY
ncbi:uncharacterized protein LOC18435935 [Amborella trichopoda]|uniref:Uncharacterized protein n=1 Tax=Amborella trichopoda TaxID=13333 RepID=W1PKR9_AMBTC|nr:uncharacterized protein LOC18435935 [Amborella trichopoda]ERN07705.1 hypothetical protein AMTR_s00155p00087370 [Amborella trichopoda]|eukprot:XP_006846030.1 uncharacterized protein LOC18435935 [Amborella trichopoda]